MARLWDAIVWWEIRRIPFNLVLLAVGLLSGFIFAVVGTHVFTPDADFGSPLLGVILYALAANLCYALGWLSELLWGWRDTVRTKAMRPKLFRIGVIFSAGLTFLPAAILTLVWAARGFR